MKREEKNSLSRQRILDAALGEFSAKGYEGASLNAVCAAYGISKGIIYHYFKDKDELYLLCAALCFDALTSYMTEAVRDLHGSTSQCLQAYFDARLCFFAQNPLYSGLFLDVTLHPPASLAPALLAVRKPFDALSLAFLTGLLECAPLRPGITAESVVEDFGMYMDFCHLRFQAALNRACPPGQALRAHEARCHRQVDILLHGVLGEPHA